MATTIKLKNSVTTTNAPSSLAQGEVAINITDKKVWVGNAATTPIQLLGDGGSASFTSIAFGAGTVSNPSITFTGDTNTGIYSPAADTIAFTEGGVESMRIDSSGNVGIGTSSPAARLDITQANPTRGIFQRVYNSTAGSSQTGAQLQFTQDSRADWVIGQPAATDAFAIWSGRNPSADGTERMRIDSSGSLLVGQTTAAVETGSIVTAKNLEITRTVDSDGAALGQLSWVNNTNAGAGSGTSFVKDVACIKGIMDGTGNNSGGYITFETKADAGSRAERMRITSTGFVLMGKTTTGLGTNGVEYEGANGGFLITRGGNPVLLVNRNTDDGTLVEFRQDNTTEGSISVSGSTVSYNGGHLSRWSQWQNQTGKPEVYRGTVLESTNDMCEWNQPNEQSTKTIVSTTAKSKAVAGVFDMYDIDDEDNPYDFYVAQSGDFVIRIAQGVVVENGDLLESAGDGTARPQTDDICRSSTIAKVTSNYVSTTYADGSYCVPCILMIG